MTKRGLIIGSQRDGLQGVHNDTAAIAERLRDRGFELDIRHDADASRDGILDAYRRMIQNSRAQDSAVIYYSGHGCRMTNAAQRSFIQCLVPTDWGQGEDFRGVLDIELSYLMSELTSKTNNVACLFDCCHSATMSREGEAARPFHKAKFIGRDWNDSATEFLAKFAPKKVRLHPESNPKAVRLAASERDRSAYEAEHELHGLLQPMGHFTWALATVLDETRDSLISWSALMGRVRELVQRLEPLQVPQLEGPGERLLFSTETTARRDAVVFFFDPQMRPMIRAARLLGAAPGIVYDILPCTSVTYDASLAIGTATVLENEGPVSLVALEPKDGPRRPETGDLAFPRKWPFPRLSVSVTGKVEDELVVGLRKRVENSRFLRAATSDEVAALRIAVEQPTRLVDANGMDVLAPLTLSRQSILALFAGAERWSRAQALLALDSQGLPARTLELRHGRVEFGLRVPMEVGEAYFVGDRPYIDIENKGPVPLWIAIFDVGVTGSVTLLTAATPTGRKLEATSAPLGSLYTLGDTFGQLTGFGPGQYPNDAPDGEMPRRESFLIVASEHPTDFFVLQTPEPRAARRSFGARSFSDVLDWVRDGALRDFGSVPATRFAVHRIDFAFHPTSRPAQPCSRTDLPRGVLAAVGPRGGVSIRRLSQKDLLPADILLSLGTGSVSDAIQALDGGWYSHAGLWCEDGIIESTDDGVRRCSLKESIEFGHRQHVDVYRHKRISASQREKVVCKAAEFLDRRYAWGDLFLGAMLVSTGAFLFRSRDTDQQRWLWAMQALNQFLSLDRERAEELVTCAELVARSYHFAELPITINLVGLRRCEGTAMFAAIAQLTRKHLRVGKAAEVALLTELSRFQSKLLELSTLPVQGATPDDSGAVGEKRLRPTAIAGVDWGANLVSPRDLMQSDDLELVGCVHP